MIKKLARFLARWHAKLKNEHDFGTLAPQIEKLARLWHVGMLARVYIDTLARMVHMACDLANSKFYSEISYFLQVSFFLT